ASVTARSNSSERPRSAKVIICPGLAPACTAGVSRASACTRSASLSRNQRAPSLVLGLAGAEQAEPLDLADAAGTGAEGVAVGAKHPVRIGPDIDAEIIIHGGAAPLQPGAHPARVPQHEVDALGADLGGAEDLPDGNAARTPLLLPSDVLLAGADPVVAGAHRRDPNDDLLMEDHALGLEEHTCRIVAAPHGNEHEKGGSGHPDHFRTSIVSRDSWASLNEGLICRPPQR